LGEQPPVTTGKYKGKYSFFRLTAAAREVYMCNKGRNKEKKIFRSLVQGDSHAADFLVNSICGIIAIPKVWRLCDSVEGRYKFSDPPT